MEVLSRAYKCPPVRTSRDSSFYYEAFGLLRASTGRCQYEGFSFQTLQEMIHRKPRQNISFQDVLPKIRVTRVL